MNCQSVKQDDMPPEQPGEERKDSFKSDTEMYTTNEETLYDADNIFFEENKALKDDQYEQHRKTVMTKESRTRKLTQVPKLS